MNVQWTLALRYLSGRKLRSSLTTLAVMFGVLVIFGINILIPTMLQSFQATMLAASNNVDMSISTQSGEIFPAGLVDTVRSVAGVRVAHGILSRQVNLPVDFFDHNPDTLDQVSTVTLVGLDIESALQVRSFKVQQGRFLQPADTAAAVISQSMADNLNLKLGEFLTLPTAVGQVDLVITGILPPRAVPGNEEILVTLPEAQRLLDSAGKVNIVEANFASGDETFRAGVQQAIQDRLGPAYQFGVLSSTSELLSSIQMAQILFNVFGLLALFMGGFIIFNTFRTLVAERRRDIGMLRAVGANRGTVIGMILAEGLLQGTVGTLAGICLGYGLGVFAMWAVSPIVESFIHIRMGLPVVTPALIVVTIVLGIGVTLLAGLLPAISAGRVTPIEALRPVLGGVSYRKFMGLSAVIGIALVGVAVLALLSGSISLISPGAVLFLLGLVLVAPALVRPLALAFGALIAATMARDGTGQLAQGNLSRQPTRAAITASTTMIALAILVVVGGIVTTMKTGFVEVLKQSLGSDYMFMPPSVSLWANNVGAQSRFVEDLKNIQGVGPVSSFRYASAVLDLKPAAPVKGAPPAASGIAVAMLGIDPLAYPQVAAMRFESGDSTQAFSSLSNGRTLIANGVMAATSGIKVGDEVPLITAAGRQMYRVVGIAMDYLNVKLVTAYVSQANLAADFGKTEDIFIQLNLAPGADRAVVEPQLKALRQHYPQFTLISGEQYLNQTLELLNIAFSAMYVVFIFFTIPSLIAMLNTLAIGVIERTREIGLLRAVGSTQKQVRRLILAEALLLAFVGTVFGLLAGLYLSYVMISALRAAGFPLDYFFPWGGLVYATLVGLVFGALAAIIPARQAARLPVVQALRYE